MILIVDPANDRGISELYKNLKNERSPVEASIVIDEKLLAIIAKEAIEVLIYHAGGRAGITINEVYENIDQLLSHRAYISLFEKIIFVIFLQNDCRFNQVPLNCHHFP